MSEFIGARTLEKLFVLSWVWLRCCFRWFVHGASCVAQTSVCVSLASIHLQDQTASLNTQTKVYAT